MRNWQEQNGQFLEKTLTETIQKYVRQIDTLISDPDKKAQKKYIDGMLKPPTKAEIRELKEFKRQ